MYFTQRIILRQGSDLYNEHFIISIKKPYQNTSRPKFYELRRQAGRMVSFISMIKEQILETWVDTCMYMHTTRTHTGKCLLSEFKTL